MSMDVGGAKGGVKSDINVTPLVDVMLVLLIIMMLDRAAAAAGRRADAADGGQHAPTSRTRPTRPSSTSTRNSKLYVNAIEVAEADARRRGSQTSSRTRPRQTVYLKGDKDAPYGAIMKMMDALRKAGIETVALITETAGSRQPGREASNVITPTCTTAPRRVVKAAKRPRPRRT